MPLDPAPGRRQSNPIVYETAGRCHCGNISFRYSAPVDPRQAPLRACQCSFCTRHGARYTAHPQGTLAAEVEDPAAVSRYRFGTGTADFHICRRCGGMPFATCEMGGRLYAVVNVNCFEDFDAAGATVDSVDYDDESEGTRLERRRERWVANVSISAGQ